MTQVLIIEGADKEVRCDCCNRKLKVGVRTNLLGTIGADCLVAKVASDRKRWNAGRPTAAWVRELAVIKETKGADWLRLRGYTSPVLFQFPLKEVA